jgi:CRP-like cAMP-binding protein
MLQAVISPSRQALPFAAPDADGLALIDRQGDELRLARDQALFWQGDEADYCYKILSGAVRMCRLLADGRRQVADFLLPGDLINFDLRGRHSMTAEAVVDCVIRRYAKRSVDRLLSDSPGAARQVISLVADRLASAQHQVVLLGRRTATERLASFLLVLARRGCPAQRPGHELGLPMNRVDIADYLGLTVETVSRLFSQLKRRRVIELPEPHRVVVRDWRALAVLAGSGEG